ncbi:hypothetical protein N7478_009415 [Penicillium angulare]|uniref:uncharacterized protein n=1 Tax=Penicillium angulare TaxID=116970 RepID=UPI002541A483|nr:uncharacterized protein N7478_009415 [Penicillium angulare]KAJ5266607.1 hypothetical protein N7478_009415 [Penicillium angulare]
MSLFQPYTSYSPVHCGCKVYIHNTWKYLPQVSLNAHAIILSSVSRTTLTQTFVNPTDFILEEVSYKFPLYDGISVVGFKCQVGTRLLHSKVKSKEQANTDYENAIEREESAAIMDHSDTQGDIFTVRLGNVPANEKVTVDITFVGELKQDAQMDGIRYTLPSSIAPRYASTWNYSQKNAQSSGFPATLNGISITADILLEKASVIRELHSTSHSPKVSLGRTSTTSSTSTSFEPSQASASLRLQKGNQPLLEQDFVLVIKADKLDTPRALLESHPDIPGQRALMATLVPKFNLPSNQPEIIFIIDRSGSMNDKIVTLQEALRVFLKSLPPGICFNICSFGSSHSFLWPRSKVYDQFSLKQALDFVNTVNANMGGTEMEPAVRATVRSRLENKDLEVLILTDGQIYDQDSLFNFVRESSSSKNTRFFSLGIGSAVSHSLIEGVARAGQGFSQSVIQNQDLDRCVVRMLKGALTPHIYDYKLEVDYEHTLVSDFEIVSDTENFMSDTETEVQSPPRATPNPAQVIKLYSDDFVEPDTILGIEGPQKGVDLPNISAPKIIQAPHKIPPLYPFIRTTVYLLLDPESSDKIPRSLTFRATSKQGSLCLRIPITDIGQGETIHQLASRKAVVELEELHGWLSESKDKSGNPFSQLHNQTQERIAARECQSLGIKYQVTGKYCSFVALEGNTEASSEGLQHGSTEVIYVETARKTSNRPVETKKKRRRVASRIFAPCTYRFCSITNNMSAVLMDRTISSPAIYSPPAMRAGRASCGRSGIQQQQMQQQQSQGQAAYSGFGGGLFGNTRGPASPSRGPTPYNARSKTRSGDFFGAASAIPQNNTGAYASSCMPTTAPPPPMVSSGCLFGSAPASGAPANAVAGSRISLAKRSSVIRDSASEEAFKMSAVAATPKSMVHALINLQEFDGSWVWEENLFNILGRAVDDIRTKIICMLQNDGIRDTMNEREDNIVATLMAMGWLRQEHPDTKATWELVYEKADAWVQQEIVQVQSEIMNAYGTEFWMEFI